MNPTRPGLCGGRTLDALDTLSSRDLGLAAGRKVAHASLAGFDVATAMSAKEGETDRRRNIRVNTNGGAFGPTKTACSPGTFLGDAADALAHLA